MMIIAELAVIVGCGWSVAWLAGLMGYRQRSG
jgi:hypothetical protein